MNIRRFSVLILVLCLSIILLAGCVAKQAASTEAPSENKEAAAENKEAGSESEADAGKSLIVYSGAGLRKPMDEIGKAFQEEFGVEIHYNYAGSAQCIGQMELVKEGDVYMAGALGEMQIAEDKGFIEEKIEFVYHIPVIGVPKGNPANITCLADMAKPGVKVILGDPKANPIGKKAVNILTKLNLIDKVEGNVVTKDPTVNEMVAHIAMKQGDAAILWEENAYGVEEIEVIEIPKEQNEIEIVPIGTLTFSTQKDLALQFINYVTSDKGKAIFEKYGYKPVTE